MLFCIGVMGMQGDNADELVFEDETDLGGDTGMATQELDVETLVDDGVEEVAELELDDIEEPSPRRSSTRSGSAPIKRQSAVAAATAAEEEEPGWVKGAAIVSAVTAGPILYEGRQVLVQ